MSDPRERLTRLVELATQHAPEKRRVLAIELCDLLLDWPANYPHAMREPFETLLEKTMRLIDRETRVALIARIAEAENTPRAFLSEYFFDAPHELRTTILARNAQTAAAARSPIDEAALIGLARSTTLDAFAEALAAALEVPPETAARILHDETAQALAVAAKGAHLSRAAFSTLAVLAGAHAPDETLARLSAYDGVAQDGAEGMIAFWRTQRASSDRRAA
jgi:hypothetical protein